MKRVVLFFTLLMVSAFALPVIAVAGTLLERRRRPEGRALDIGYDDNDPGVDVDDLN